MLYGSGAEQLTLWPEVSPASRTALQGAARGERTSATCGPSSHEWCARFDPDGCLLRTFLACVLQQRTRCSLIWTRRDTPAGRSWWVLTTLEPRTAGSACGSWPTAVAQDESPEAHMAMKSRMKGGPRNTITSLQVMAKALWPTAKESDGRSKGTGGSPDHGLDAMARKGLLWPTSTAQDSSGSGSAGYSTESGRHEGTTLTDAANGLWASPQARDWKDSGPTQGNRKSPNVGTQATRLSCEAGPPDQESSSTSGKPQGWPTARSQDSYERRNWKTVVKVNEQGGDLTLPSEVLYEQKSRGSLNPAWVAQLMGVPDGWLDGCDVPNSEPSATASSPRSSAKSGERSSKRKE